MTNTRSLRTLILACVTLSAGQVLARPNTLEDQPVVRHKAELRDKRFELSPTVEISVASDYITTVSFGAKAEYHLTDSLSLGGGFFFGSAVKTSLADKVEATLPASEPPMPTEAQKDDPQPTQSQFNQHLNTMPQHGALYATFTPWFGKMAAFGKAFVNFDVYTRGGLSFASLRNTSANDKCAPVKDYVSMAELKLEPDKVTYDQAKNDCPHNAGTQAGMLLGAGIHVYINKWIAADISVSDYLFADNPSGFDATHDGKVDENDRRFMNHLFFGVGVSMFLPSKSNTSR